MSGPFSYATITQAKRRAKTKRGKRFLEAKEPKVRENPKATMFVRGPGQGVELTELMKDLVRSFIALFGGCALLVAAFGGSLRCRGACLPTPPSVTDPQPHDSEPASPTS